MFVFFQLSISVKLIHIRTHTVSFLLLFSFLLYDFRSLKSLMTSYIDHTTHFYIIIYQFNSLDSQNGCVNVWWWCYAIPFHFSLWPRRSDQFIWKTHVWPIDVKLPTTIDPFYCCFASLASIWLLLVVWLSLFPL